MIGASAGTGLVGRLGADTLALRVIVPVLSLAVSVTFCAGLYRVMSGGMVTSRSAFAGGTIGGLVLLVTPTAAGYYVGLAADRTPVGVFLVLAGVTPCAPHRPNSRSQRRRLSGGHLCPRAGRPRR